MASGEFRQKWGKCDLPGTCLVMSGAPLPHCITNPLAERKMLKRRVRTD